MKRTTMAPGCPGRGIYQRLPFLLTAICVVGSLHATVPAYAVETGIRGTVLWGPVGPGPTSPGEDDEAPLSASFTVYGPQRAVVRFESDDTGCFEVLLPAGEYTIVPHKGTPIPYPERQKTQVIVPKDGFAVVTIRLDTGMR